MPATETSPNSSRIIAFRAPERLERQVEAIAERDSNSLSATLRRFDHRRPALRRAERP
jgi:hypothetical protein